MSMEYTSNEKQILSLMERADFRKKCIPPFLCTIGGEYVFR